jgi:NTP pyrophosphatase (non-canonical NTP hydrolase)
MTLTEYTKGCLNTWEGENKLQEAWFGLFEEIGEIAGKQKKFVRGDYDKLHRDIMLIKELGDAMYYLHMLIYELGFSVEGVAQQNLDKLHDRKARGVIKGSGDER